MSEMGIYIHYPFCLKKCSYCDFLSFDDDVFSTAEKRQLYFESLCNQLKENAKVYGEKVVKSIFFGGGTPSLMTDNQIKEILKQVKENFVLSDTCEITMECNPETITKDKLKAMDIAGINRLSIGLQTVDDDILSVIGRQHNYQKFLEVYKDARQVGFNNINIDLMFNLPFQTKKVIEKTMAEVIKLSPEHLSIYSLKLEEGTPLYRQVESKALSIEDEFEDRAFYYEMLDTFEKHGYHQYEISNMAKDGYECVHNKIYWHNEMYLAIGLGAHGKIIDDKGKVRYSITTDFERYIKAQDVEAYIEDKEIIDESEDLFETIILGLRLNEGLDIEKVNAQYKIDFERQYIEALKKHQSYHLLKIVDGKVILTRKGMDLSNQVFMDFS